MKEEREGGMRGVSGWVKEEREGGMRGVSG